MAQSSAPTQSQLCHTLQFIMTQGFPILQLTMQQWLLFTQRTLPPPQFMQHMPLLHPSLQFTTQYIRLQYMQFTMHLHMACHMQHMQCMVQHM